MWNARSKLRFEGFSKRLIWRTQKLVIMERGRSDKIVRVLIDEIVDTEWKRLLLGVLPQLEDHSNEFWSVIRENPAMLEDLGRHLVRTACEALAEKE